MDDPTTKDRSKGVVIASTLIAAQEEIGTGRGRFYIPTTKYLHSGFFLLCYTFVKPPIAVSSPGITEYRTLSAEAQHVKLINDFLDSRNMQFVSDTVCFRVTVETRANMRQGTSHQKKRKSRSQTPAPASSAAAPAPCTKRRKTPSRGWTDGEDSVLKQIVENTKKIAVGSLSTSHWEVIAEHLPRRSPSDCWYRFQKITGA